MKFSRIFLLLIAYNIMSIATAKADYDFYVGGLYYRVLSLENLTCSVVDPINVSNNIQHKSEYSGNVIIPSTVEFANRTFTVVEISDYAFYDCPAYRVEIPGTVHTIRQRAFWCAENLQYVEIKDGVKVIMYDAFEGCDNIVSLRLPNTLEEIGLQAFKSCHCCPIKIWECSLKSLKYS